MTQRLRFGSHQQTVLPLIQMREQHRELRCQRLLEPLRYSHIATMTARTRSYGLILCTLLIDPLTRSLFQGVGREVNPA